MATRTRAAATVPSRVTVTPSRFFPSAGSSAPWRSPWRRLARSRTTGSRWRRAPRTQLPSTSRASTKDMLSKWGFGVGRVAEHTDTLVEALRQVIAAYMPADLLRTKDFAPAEGNIAKLPFGEHALREWKAGSRPKSDPRTGLCANTESRSASPPRKPDRPGGHSLPLRPVRKPGRSSSRDGPGGRSRRGGGGGGPGRRLPEV